MVARLSQAIASYKTARAAYRLRSYFQEAQSLSKTARAYAKVFGLKLPKLPQVPKWDKAKYETAQAQASARELEARACRDREAEAYEQKQAESIALWKAGADTYIGCTRHAFLRLIQVDGLYHVETSQRVTVPVSGPAGAARLFRFLKAVKDSSREYVRNGHTEHIGAFAVDSFKVEEVTYLDSAPEPQYVLCAGCHRITWTEINSIAADVLSAEETELYEQANLEHAQEHDIPTAE
jgi:multidrug efflux pump subunit AcrA (membrane-fusion protein)